MSKNRPVDMNKYTPTNETLNFIESDARNVSTFPELNNSITDTELLKAIRKLRNNKSTGTDLLPNELFKQVECLQHCW